MVGAHLPSTPMALSSLAMRKANSMHINGGALIIRIGVLGVPYYGHSII